MNILYVSSLASEKLVSDIYFKTKANPGFAVQKFTRLLVKGLAKNDVPVISLSNPPINNAYNDRLWVSLGTETEEDIKYKYMPFINLPVLKHICIFFYSFFYVLGM